MLYLDPPKEFESIGIVDASVPQGFSRQATQNRLIDKLKKEAAKIGANGIILQNTGTEYSGTTGYTINGIYHSQTSEKNVARGRAIYVTKE